MVCVCGWQDIGMVICESFVVSFLPFFCDFIPTCSFILDDFSKTCILSTSTAGML